MKIKYFRNDKQKLHFRYTVTGNKTIQMNMKTKKESIYHYRDNENAEEVFDLLKGTMSEPEIVEDQGGNEEE